MALSVLLADFGPPWALCGGWAVDAWVGRQTRDHLDVDVAMFEGDQLELHRFLADGWLLNGHDRFDDDSTVQWDGHRLLVPGHVHARGHEQNLDVQLERVKDDAWIIRDEPRLALPLTELKRTTQWGVPALPAEVVLFFKSEGTIREHDRADLAILAPLLGAPRRAWLRDAIAARDASHPWVGQLG